jgi:hypothetical protein
MRWPWGVTGARSPQVERLERQNAEIIDLLEIIADKGARGGDLDLLRSLRLSGLLSQDEYRKQRKELLRRSGNVAADNIAPLPPITASSDEANLRSSAPELNNQQGEAEAQANKLLAEARQCAHGGDKSQAISLLRALLRQYPGTDAAHTARRSLEKSGVSPHEFRGHRPESP